MSKKTQDSIIKEFLKDRTGRGRSELAKAMAAPLRQRLDYTSIGRKTYIAEQLGFHCETCGFTNPDKKYKHSPEECVVSEVILK